jgi:hypothetical protein
MQTKFVQLVNMMFELLCWWVATKGLNHSKVCYRCTFIDFRKFWKQIFTFRKLDQSKEGKRTDNWNSIVVDFIYTLGLTILLLKLQSFVSRIRGVED